MPKQDDRNSTMYVFPGQGSQYVGMGKDLCDEFEVARQVYSSASEALGYDVAELSFRDPNNCLASTEYTQPALLTHSIACLRVFEELTASSNLAPAICAGHSLGEYSALVAADSLSLEQAVRLVRKRGQVMSEFGTGQMLAVPLSIAEVNKYAQRHYCAIGGCNLPKQTIVGGLEDDLEAFAEDIRTEHPRLRMTKLKTDGAFHTYLMAEAATKFRTALSEVNLRPPKCKLLSNYTGDFHEDSPASIRYRLFFQLFHPVRWLWGLERALVTGVGTIVEFGGGIGAEDDPLRKRPNLASTIKRTIRQGQGRVGRREQDVVTSTTRAIYSPAINARTVKETAELCLSLSRTQLEPSNLPALALSGSWYHLHVPTVAGVPLACSHDALQCVAALGLSKWVQVITEDVETNAKFVAGLDPNQKGNAPYLKTVAGKESSSRYSLSKEIEEELSAAASSLG